jgi:hypothetical protein
MYDRRSDEEKTRDEQEDLEWVRMQQDQADRKTAALRVELERMKALAEAGTQRNVRGSVTKLLLPRIDILREATRLGTPITQQLEMLDRAGIEVSYNSLRKFIQKHLAVEYRENLANSRTTGADPEILESDLKGAEKAEVRAFLEGGTQRDQEKSAKPVSDDDAMRDALAEAVQPRKFKPHPKEIKND